MPGMIIDNEIVFFPEEKKLSSLRNGKSIIIFSTGARCLEHLIDKQGIIVSQKELISVGWVEDDAYKTVSQATYYQCLTDLRKNFKDLGYDKPLINTVRGQGVRINADIMMTSTADESAVTGAEQTPPFSQPARVSSAKKKSWLFMMFALAIAMLIASVYVATTRWQHKDSIDGEYQSIENYPSCYLFNKENTDNELIVKYLQKKNFNCQSARRYYISHSPTTPRLTVFSCSTTEPTTCESFTFLDSLS